MHEIRFYPDPVPALPVINKPEHTKELLDHEGEPEETPFDKIDMTPPLTQFTTVHATLADAYKASGWGICQRFLGAGKWGQVYLGFRLTDMRLPLTDRHLCAVKQSYIWQEDAPVRDMMIHEKKVGRGSDRPVTEWKTPEMIMIEATVLKCLKHEHVVKLLHHYAVQENRSFYLLMEYCDAGDLDHEQNMMPGYAFKIRVARYYFKQIMQGVKYIHDRGIGHGDIKPANMLLRINPSGTGKTVRIADFGLSGICFRHRPDGRYSIINVHGVNGTMAYLAPEILNHRVMPDVVKTYTPYPMSPEDAATGKKYVVEPPVEKRRPIIWTRAYEKKFYRLQPADMYACGIMLYKMIAGFYPYDHRAWPKGLDLVFRRQPMTCFKRIDMKTWEQILFMLEPLTEEPPDDSPVKMYRATADLILHDQWINRETVASGTIPTHLDQYKTMFNAGLYDLPVDTPETMNLVTDEEIDRTAHALIRLNMSQAEARALDFRPRVRPGRGRDRPSRVRSSSQPGPGLPVRTGSQGESHGVRSSSQPGAGRGRRRHSEDAGSRTRHQ